MNISLYIIDGLNFSVNLFPRLSCLCKGMSVPFFPSWRSDAQDIVDPVETMHNFIHHLWKTSFTFVISQKEIHTDLWIILFKCFCFLCYDIFTFFRE